MQQEILLSRALFWIAPLLLGLALTYALMSYVDLRFDTSRRVQDPLRDRMRDARSQADTLKKSIMEKNILALANPEPKSEPDKAAKGDTGSRAKPKSWPLIGLVSGDNPMALVQAQGEFQLLRPGQSVADWTLDRINAESVTWKRGEEKIRTSLWADAEQVELKSGTSNTVSLSGSRVRPMLQDPSNILQQALFKPNMKEGNVFGFKVDNIQDDSILRRLGLKNKDVLVRINGETITGPSKMISLYSGIKDSDVVSLDILRNGEPLSLMVKLE